jgi:SPP1 gp7 family putative phage head morphogenesis protein
MVKTPNIFSSFFKTTPNTPAAARVKDESPMALIAKGSSGTEIYSGYFDEEYLSKLQAERGIKVFDEMRRSDGQVKMLLSAVKNPIKSASWEIEAAGEEESDYEIRDFIHHILFKDIGNVEGTKYKTFNEFISEALTMIEYGFSSFEIVHKMVKGDKAFGDYLGIADFGFRHQRSILEWILNDDGSIAAIRQNVNGDLGRDVFISGQHMLIFSIEKEGDNYQGISMLRPCYGAWFRKNIYRKLQAIGIERCAKGVPIGTVSADAKGQANYAAQLSDFQYLIDQLSAHEKNGIVLGAGFDLKELKMTHDAEAVQKVIDSENIEMSKAFLANFMELGLSGNSGSFALGSDLSDIFLSGIEYIAEMICEKINNQVIPPLVRAKYGDQDAYPKLRVSGINDKAGKELSEIIVALSGAKAIQASTRLQRYLHKLYKLPDLDEEIAAMDDEKFLNPAPPPNPAAPIEPKLHEKKNCDHDHRETVYQLSDIDREAFPVSAKIEDNAADLKDFMVKSLKARSSEMLSEMERIINKGPSNTRDLVLSVVMPKSKAYATALENWAGDLVEATFSDTIKEIGLKEKDVTFADGLKKAPKKLREKLVKMAVLVSEYQDVDLEKAVYFAFNENFETLDAPKLAKEMRAVADKYFEKGLIETAAVNMAASVINSTRKETFLSPDVAGGVESFVFMNPDPVSPICKALNGKVFSKQEFETSSLTPPLHHNCKSYIRAQTTGKAGNLPITGLKIDGTKEEIKEILRSKTL